MKKPIDFLFYWYNSGDSIFKCLIDSIIFILLLAILAGLILLVVAYPVIIIGTTSAIVFSVCVTKLIIEGIGKWIDFKHLKDK